MFCPSCGIDDKGSNQFCRACGSNLSIVRSAVERPDGVTSSAITAREEIGRAVAGRIREVQSASELKRVAEDVLPEIEKFLESPQEKKMRRLRIGTIISSVGLGVTVGLTIAAIGMGEAGVLFLAGLGAIVFFLGLGFIVNAILFTIPRKSLDDLSGDAEKQRSLDAATGGLDLPKPNTLFASSVTEHTTQHLHEKTPVRRE